MDFAVCDVSFFDIPFLTVFCFYGKIDYRNEGIIMHNIRFVSDTIDDFTFQKNISSNKEIKLETSVKYTVRFVAEKNILIGDAIITIHDAEHEGLFRLKFHHLSQFQLDFQPDDTTKKEIHTETAQILFPLWNRSLRSFCAMASLPPIQLPPYKVEESNIRVN